VAWGEGELDGKVVGASNEQFPLTSSCSTVGCSTLCDGTWEGRR
jgi:hypothetical protein